MAGTGLPLPKNRGSIAQPAKLTPMIDADKYSTAPEWNLVARASAGLASVGEGIADKAEAEARRQELEQRAGYLAEQENEIAAKRIELADLHHDDPQAFQSAWKGYSDGKMTGAPSWSRAQITKALGGAGNAAYASLLNVKRAQDQKLAADRLNTLITRSGDDVVGSAMAGQMGTPDWEQKVAKLQGSLDSAVNLKLMPQEKADEIRDDVVARAHGEVATRRALQVYQEKGFDAAATDLRTSILESQSSLSPAQKQAAFNKGLAAIRLQKQQDAQDRGEFVSAATDLIAGIQAGQDIDQAQLSDLQAGLRRTGAIGVLSRLNGAVAIKQATAPLSNLPPAQAYAYVRNLREGGGGVPIGPQLARAESGGKADAVNQFGYAGKYQFGAPRLADLGVYQPGQGENLVDWSKGPRDAEGKWSGTFNIPGFPQVKTLQDFLGNADAQDAVMKLQQQRANQEIDVRGMDRYLGQTVGGVVVTRPGLQAMIHLGGPGSAQAFLESGGRTNPADANGKTVGDYARLGETAVDRAFPLAGVVTKAIQSQYVQQMRKDWPEMKAVIESGKVASPQDFAAIQYAASLSGDAAWKREVDALATANRANEVLRGTTIGQGQGVIDSLRKEFDADGVRSVDEDRILKAAEESFRLKAKQVTDSPVDYALSMGAPAPPPLTFDNADASRQAVRARVDLARGVAGDQQVAPGSPFREADRKQIAGAIASGTAQQAAIAMDGLFQVPDDMLGPALTPDLRAAVQGAARSSDGAKYGAAMSFLDRMWARAPETTKQLFGEDAIHDLQTWQAQSRYMTPEQMQEQRAKLSADPQVKAREKANLQDGLEFARKYKADDIVKQFDTSWWLTPGPVARGIGSQPMPVVDALARDTLAGDFETIYARRYAETLNKDQALTQTMEQLKTKWSASPINGNRLMQ